ncbi:hypothetical protein [Anaerosinus massiliensis]|uniref:hypothetical protein n=1 Tax=Massilibacillus massiliensis TaxID=1806837 RepID=UPI000DA62DD0|nr:hypothetical protein [Massilibacillus massiliensis]
MTKKERPLIFTINALGKIFDKKKVQEQQELTKVFGQEAYKAIGDLSLKQYKKALDDAAKADKAGDKTAWELMGSGLSYIKIDLRDKGTGLVSHKWKRWYTNNEIFK